ncbi:MAG: hypothetical protein IPK17_39360 [Chloroflexi bacterium]|uniref:hypothetical protein n=1 Tax=Candidatus Flexifilum breve TaxID=3140694 RepID=UPI003136347D|nr:hypothetical protein [Chloroflexota bacterium]
MDEGLGDPIAARWSAGLVVLLLVQPAVCPVNQVSATALATPTSAPPSPPGLMRPSWRRSAWSAAPFPAICSCAHTLARNSPNSGTLVTELTALGLTDDGWVTVNLRRTARLAARGKSTVCRAYARPCPACAIR